MYLGDHLVSLYDIESSWLEFHCDSFQMGQVLVYGHEHNNEFERGDTVEDLLCITAVPSIPVGVHVAIIGEVALVTYLLKDVDDKCESSIKVWISTMARCPADLTKVQQRLSFGFICNIVSNVQGR